MTDKKSNNSRRKLLKSIVAGSGAVVAEKALPESWHKPVINSILLPAHAETTLAQTDCSTSLPFGSISISCSDNELAENFAVEIDDSGVCPKLEVKSIGNVDPEGLGIRLVRSISTSGNNTFGLTVFKDGVEGGLTATVEGGSTQCDVVPGPPLLITGFNPGLPVSVVGAKGTYQATFTVTVSNDNLSVMLDATTFKLVA